MIRPKDAAGRKPGWPRRSGATDGGAHLVSIGKRPAAAFHQVRRRPHRKRRDPFPAATPPFPLSSICRRGAAAGPHRGHTLAGSISGADNQASAAKAALRQSAWTSECTLYAASLRDTRCGRGRLDHRRCCDRCGHQPTRDCTRRHTVGERRLVKRWLAAPLALVTAGVTAAPTSMHHPAIRPGVTLSFPQDHGAHPAFRTG
ncbi:hypothetical protein FHS96_005890 [Sphingomonas zeicaulis]